MLFGVSACSSLVTDMEGTEQTRNLDFPQISPGFPWLAKEPVFVFLGVLSGQARRGSLRNRESANKRAHAASTSPLFAGLLKMILYINPLFFETG